MRQGDLARRAYAGLGDHPGADRLVERDPAGGADRPDERHVEQGEHLAQRPVLAGLAVQHREHHRAGMLGQPAEQPGVDVGLDHVEALAAQRLGHPPPRAERHVPLMGQPTGQHHYCLHAYASRAHSWFGLGPCWYAGGSAPRSRPEPTAVPKVSMTLVSLCSTSPSRRVPSMIRSGVGKQ